MLSKNLLTDLENTKGELMANTIIDEAACKGCGLCVSACPTKILELSKNHTNANGYFPVQNTNPSKCIGCAACAIMCPDCVIEVEK